MNEVEYLLGDEQDEEKTDRELSEEELEAVAGGKGLQRGIKRDLAGDVQGDVASNVEGDISGDVAGDVSGDVSGAEQ